MSQPQVVASRPDRIAKIAFRARNLVSSLLTVVRGDYPVEAKELAAVIAALTAHLAAEIEHIARNSAGHVSDDDAQRAKGLFQILQEFYKCVEYLIGSDSRWCPPSIQTLTSELVDRYFPVGQSRVIALVRPQWAYNLEYYPLLAELREYLRLEIFDRDNRLNIDLNALYPLLISDPDLYDRTVARELVRSSWERYFGSAKIDDLPNSPPDEIGILSFAGLDTSDTFQFSILSHELAHFLHLNAANDIVAATKDFFVDLSAVHKIMPKAVSQEVLQFCWQDANTRIMIAVREIVADLTAVRMLGVGYLFAHMELLLSLADWPQNQLLSNGYPGIAYRIKLVLQELAASHNPTGRPIIPIPSRDDDKYTFDFLQRYISSLEQVTSDALKDPFRLDRCTGFILRDQALEIAVHGLVVSTVEQGLNKARDIAVNLVPQANVRPLANSFYNRVRALRAGLPPYLATDTSDALGAIMAAAWTRALVDQGEFSSGDDDGLQAYQRDCRLLLKALELATARFATSTLTDHELQPLNTRIGAVLSAPEIEERCATADDTRRLIIMPLLPGAIQSASVDLTLGQWFKVARRTRLPAIDLTTPHGRQEATELAHDEFFLPFQKTLTIHPGDFVLAVTFEYVSIPPDLMATVEGRSAAGRTGLTIATSTPVGPGFKGSIVLELAHAGAVPITIKPGLGIAQMLIYQLTSAAPPYTGRFQYQTRP